MPQIKTLLSAASEFAVSVRMQPGKQPEGEIGSLVGFSREPETREIGSLVTPSG